MNDKEKARLKRYADKCIRMQILLNPNNKDDAKIIDYFNANDDGKPIATQLKTILLKYIEMSTLLRNFSNFD